MLYLNIRPHARFFTSYSLKVCFRSEFSVVLYVFDTCDSQCRACSRPHDEVFFNDGFLMNILLKGALAGRWPLLASDHNM